MCVGDDTYIAGAEAAASKAEPQSALEEVVAGQNRRFRMSGSRVFFVFFVVFFFQQPVLLSVLEVLFSSPTDSEYIP